MTRAEAVLAILNERNGLLRSKDEIIKAARQNEKPLIVELTSNSEAYKAFKEFAEQGMDRDNLHQMTPFVGIFAVGWAAAIKWMEANAVKEPLKGKPA